VTALPNVIISVDLSIIVHFCYLWHLDKDHLASVPLNQLGLLPEDSLDLSLVSQKIVRKLSSMLNHKLRFEDSCFEHVDRVLTPQSFKDLILDWLMDGFDGSPLVFVLKSSYTAVEQIERMRSNIAAFAH